MPILLMALAITAVTVLAIVIIVALLERYWVHLETNVGEVGGRLSLEPM